LANYALHYVGGGRGEALSADYFGMCATTIERNLGKPPRPDLPRPVAILTNGCSGNINNIDVRKRIKQPHPYAQMEKVAQLVADETLRVLKTIDYQSSISLDAHEMQLEFGVRRPTRREIDEARELVQNAKSDLRTLREIYARETLLLEDWPESIRTCVQAIRIGDMAIATFPGEAFVELGLEVKKRSPFAITSCIELANDYVGYIPTRAAYDQGGYETWRARSSFLAPGAGEEMVAVTLELLEQMDRAK
jgi:hypothetical protein